MPSLARRAPNPFYIFLMVVSTAFVVTILAYLVAPYVADGTEGEAARSGAAGWINRHAPKVLAIELGLMILSALLAIATDHLFAPKDDGTSDRG